MAGWSGHTDQASRLMYVKAPPQDIVHILEMTVFLGAPWWLSGLGIQHCHCYGAGSIPGPGTFECHGHCQKKKKKCFSSEEDEYSHKEGILPFIGKFFKLTSYQIGQ